MVGSTGPLLPRPCLRPCLRPLPQSEAPLATGRQYLLELL
jgi:hypothetical protein